jgi:hypothetical protein
MAFSNAEVQAFYDELVADGDLAPAEREQLAAVMAKKEGKFKSGVLAQKDYTSKMNTGQADLARLKREYEDKVAAVASMTEDMGAGGITQAQYDAAVADRDKLIKERNEIQMEYLKAVQNIRTSYRDADEIIKNAGMKPDGMVVATGINSPAAGATTPGTAGAAPAVDLSGYVKQDAAQFMVGSILDWEAQRDELQYEYQQLTGKRLSSVEMMQHLKANAATRNPLPPQQYIEQVYKFGELRTQKQQADLEARVQKMFDEKWSAAESKRLAAATAAQGDQSGISSIFEGSNEGEATTHPDIIPGTGEMYADAERVAMKQLEQARSVGTGVM